jgi:topoisomerase-4 subunit B
LYILDTPLFRVRNKQETIYCYSESEKQAAMARLGARAEVTRFKGLGEISPDEFGRFIGPDMRLEPIILKADTSIPKLLAYYMGKNTPERQQFIVENLRWEMDAPQGVALANEESAVPALTEG